MLTYTTKAALQQIQRDYVKDTTSHIKFCRYYLCELIGRPKSDGENLYPMAYLKEIASKQNKPVIEYIKQYSDAYTMNMAINALIENHCQLGFDTFNARLRDKEMEEIGFNPTYLTNLVNSLDAKIVHTPNY